MAFAYWIHYLLSGAGQTYYQQAVTAAAGEWQ
jgi:hypothetical protein